MQVVYCISEWKQRISLYTTWENTLNVTLYTCNALYPPPSLSPSYTYVILSMWWKALTHPLFVPFHKSVFPRDVENWNSHAHSAPRRNILFFLFFLSFAGTRKSGRGQTAAPSIVRVPQAVIGRHTWLTQTHSGYSSFFPPCITLVLPLFFFFLTLAVSLQVDKQSRGKSNVMRSIIVCELFSPLTAAKIRNINSTVC